MVGPTRSRRPADPHARRRDRQPRRPDRHGPARQATDADRDTDPVRHDPSGNAGRRRARGPDHRQHANPFGRPFDGRRIGRRRPGRRRSRDAYPRSIGTASICRSCCRCCPSPGSATPICLLTALELPPDVIADTQRCLDIMRGRNRKPDRAGIDARRASGLRAGAHPVPADAAVPRYLRRVAMALAKGAFGLPPMRWVGIPGRWSCQMAGGACHAGDGPRDALSAAHSARAAALFGAGTDAALGRPVRRRPGAGHAVLLRHHADDRPAGAVPLAAHQIVMNYGTITSSFAVSSGDAAALRIGFFRGRHAFADARRAGFVGIAMSFAMTSTAATCVALFPDFFLGLFLDLNAPETQPIVAVSRSLALMSILWVLIDGVYVASLGLPRATDDNRFAMLAVPFVYWGLGLPPPMFSPRRCSSGCRLLVRLRAGAERQCADPDRTIRLGQPPCSQAAVMAQPTHGPVLVRPASATTRMNKPGRASQGGCGRRGRCPARGCAAPPRACGKRMRAASPQPGIVPPSRARSGRGARDFCRPRGARVLVRRVRTTFAPRS